MLKNMDPEYWGKYYWGTIYFIVLNYPDSPTKEDKQNVKSFFEMLKSLLPCENCANHYKKNLNTYPLTDDILSSKTKLLDWVLIINNEVNKRQGKNEKTIDDIMIYYLSEKKPRNYTQLATILLLIFLIILLICYAKYKKD